MRQYVGNYSDCPRCQLAAMQERAEKAEAERDKLLEAKDAGVRAALHAGG
jgi:protein-disulfide isomerase